MENNQGVLVACHECDALYRREPIPVNARANCTRCGSVLYRQIPDAMNRCIALYLAALMLWIMANSYPFLSLKVGGLVEENLLYSGGWALYKFGMPELGVLVFLTSIVFPFVTITGLLYLLIPLRFSHVPPFRGRVVRVVTTLEPWSLIGVFFLGTLISVVKLQDLATVIPGLSLFAFAALLFVYSGARANFDSELIWADKPNLREDGLGGSTSVVNCHTCGMLHLRDTHPERCVRCEAPIHFRVEDSLHRTWALLGAATLMLIPANLYPVMTVTKLGKGDPSTIISGVIDLMHAGLWGLAFIVLLASIVVPVAKLLTLSFLLTSVRRGSQWRPRDRTLLYRVTEVVGAWSMVDVFLVGMLAGLVSLGFLATIEPGIGATFFGGAVILTMLAAHSFDPRLIWDGMVSEEDDK
ncbi:MAG TPA: paraquat-inducible membrane protein A [Gammaproteobacteria bacterium]|nr:paraquat-inducible membrane protein A [Gammaproteobacteria bacterium]